MATKFQIEHYSSFTSAKEALSWSDNDEIVLCTDEALHISKFHYASTQRGCVPSLYKTCIVQEKEPFKLVLLDDENIEKMKRNVSDAELNGWCVDRTLNPNLTSSIGIGKSFCGASWSPTGADQCERCILASLSTDHRVAVYSRFQSDNKWKKACDLSEIYLSQHPIQKEDFSTLKRTCYQAAAVVIDWSPEIYKEADTSRKYSVLAVGMKSGHIILWKIYLPFLSETECQIVATVLPHCSVPSAFSWCSSKGVFRMFAVGYLDGTVSVVQMDSDFACQVTSVQDEKDLMRVSCMCWVRCEKLQFDLLFINKESYIHAYAIDVIDGKTKVVCQTPYTLAENTLPGTGFCHRDGVIVMSSADGIIQRLTVDGTDEKNISISCLKSSYSISIDDIHHWSCQGIALSKHAMFLMAVYRSSSYYDHLEIKMRNPTKLCILPTYQHSVVDLAEVFNNWFTDETGLNESADLLHVYRAELSLEKIHISKVVEYLTQFDPVILGHLPLRTLRIIRFHLMCQCQSIPKLDSVEEEQEKEKEEMSKLNQINDLICGQYIQNCVTKAINGSKFTLQDRQTISAMVQFLEQRQLWDKLPSKHSPNSLTEHLLEVEPWKCAICEQDILECMSTMKCGALYFSESRGLHINFNIQLTSPLLQLDDTILTISCTLIKGKTVMYRPILFTSLLSVNYHLQEENYSCTCPNGHRFGLCLKTFKPCCDLQYRTCSLCRVFYVSLESLNKISWIQDMSKCTLCDGQII
ncbi:hypothetical protein CHS0354_017370 [Potamilus streckersoni]|uniref:Transcription factor IIIC 90kDa subunit N-terminal domain-containing protein n=1 Tax=Potamilus streckersoni TaxID=2493646 RepID=A0AAE0T4K3_9BIVA|nr:hypothetical protein CHS0354_017370 [Potamilus streckersoni]